MSQIRKEYTDLLAFTFGLQLEMKQAKKAVPQKTKALLLQSIRDLTQKKKSLIKALDTVLGEQSSMWLKNSKKCFEEQDTDRVALLVRD